MTRRDSEEPTATGLLLVNLGTPASPEIADVRRYLAQFLMDGRVLDIPAWRRFLLVHLVILRRRPGRSAAAYRKIWTERGSPLLVHGLDLRDRVRRRLGQSVRVELGMRYGEPSIESALRALAAASVERLVVLPLYAQASEASTGSSVAEVERVARQVCPGITIETVRPFFEHPAYLGVKASMVRPKLEAFDPDLVLFSYHGLPVRQLVRAAPQLGCSADDTCCSRPQARQHCYRAQCLANADALRQRLDILPEQSRVGFQSRLGRTPWIEPFTDRVLVESAQQGYRRVAVVSGFLADCLETLEEIAIAGSELFRSHGGEALRLVPAPNADDRWADAVVELFTESLARLPDRNPRTARAPR